MGEALLTLCGFLFLGLCLIYAGHAAGDRSKNREAQFNARWGDLADYNAEKSRGIVHAPERDAAMAAKQASYDEMLRRGLDLWTDPIPTQCA